MTKHPNAIKLHASFVPNWTHKTTLEMEGYLALQKSILNKEFRQGECLKNYYMQAVTDDQRNIERAVRITSVLAKQLRLSGNALIWVTMAGVMQELRARSMEREIEQVNPVLTQRGKGYITISDFGAYLDPSSIWGWHATASLGDFLLSHLHDGGGLVLGGMNPERFNTACFGIDFADTLQRHFEMHQIK